MKRVSHALALPLTCPCHHCTPACVPVRVQVPVPGLGCPSRSLTRHAQNLNPGAAAGCACQQQSQGQSQHQRQHQCVPRPPRLGCLRGQQSWAESWDARGQRKAGRRRCDGELRLLPQLQRPARLPECQHGHHLRQRGRPARSHARVHYCLGLLTRGDRQMQACSACRRREAPSAPVAGHRATASPPCDERAPGRETTETALSLSWCQRQCRPRQRNRCLSPCESW